MKRILLIEDEVEYSQLVSSLLTDEGYFVEVTDNAIDGIKKMTQNYFDLVISDLYLNRIDGFKLVEVIRKKSRKMKIIMLTGSGTDDDELKGLRLGVNDFIRKESSFEVILQRIQNVFAPSVTCVTRNEILKSEFDNLIVNITEYTVYKNGEEVILTPLEFDLLTYFLKNKNILLGRDEIIENVWMVSVNEMKMSQRTVDTHVKNLRRKLKIKSIYSIRNGGYKWNER